MIRTVGVADAQEQLNEMVTCLERGDHIYIQEVDPLTPEYELPDTTPEQYKKALKKHYGNRLLKDHWNGIDKWDYYYLKEVPKPLPMEYPPEVIDTEKLAKEEKQKNGKKDGKSEGKKKLSMWDVFISSGNKRVKKEPVEEKKEEEPVKPKQPVKPLIPFVNEPDEERLITEGKDIPNEAKVVKRKPRTIRNPNTVVQNRKPRKPKTLPVDSVEMEEILQRDEQMNQKIRDIVDEYEGKQ